MKRDIDLIREIVLAIQSQAVPELRRLQIDEYDENVVGRRVDMLIDAGYVHGNVHSSSIGTRLTAFVTDLTWEGHHFAAALENDTVWAA